MAFAVKVAGGNFVDIIRKKHSKRIGLMIMAGLLLSLLLVFIIFMVQNKTHSFIYENKDEIIVAEVQYRPFQEFINVNATVTPLFTRYIVAPRNGYIESFFCTTSDLVPVNQELFQFESSELEKELSALNWEIQQSALDREKQLISNFLMECSFNSNLHQLEYQLNLLEKELSVSILRYESGAISRSTLEALQLKYKYHKTQKTALLEQHELEKQLAELNDKQQLLSDSLLKQKYQELLEQKDDLLFRAPIDGQISSIYKTAGQNIAKDTPVLRIDSSSEFKLNALIDDFYLSKVKIGQKVTLSAYKEYPLTVQYISPIVENNLFAVELIFNTAIPTGIKTGQNFLVRLELSSNQQILTIPNEAHYAETAGRWIFVLDKNKSVASRREIKIGRVNSEYIEILSGLLEYEKVLISSYTNYGEINSIKLLTNKEKQ